MQLQNPALYASVGRELTHYEVDVAGASLTKRATIKLPQKVQYVWPHPTLPFLYAACSSGGPEARGDAHSAVALRVASDGALAISGFPVPLPSRPIHTTVDRDGTHLLTAYSNPSGLTIHPIGADGSIGRELAQEVKPDTGIYAHQVKVSPSNRTVILVSRGNDASEAKGEDPGALKVFEYDSGQVKLLASVAPGEGYGFGPRHIDFHPSQPWVYASLERQNTLHMYRMTGDSLETQPAFVKETLADRRGMRRRQRPGTAHVHPNGRFVYVANRASGTETVDGQPLYIGGENNIAVYEIDLETGEPNLVQHADTHGIVPRTFALDRSGRLLVAANSVSILAKEGGRVVTIPPSLAVFRVADDGTLEYVRKYDVDAGPETVFWMGIVG